MPTDAERYSKLIAAITRPGDEAPQSSLLALWFLRHALVVDELDAYEFLLDEPESGIVALFPESGFDITEPKALHLIHVADATEPREFGLDTIEGLIDIGEKLCEGESDDFSPQLNAMLRRYELTDGVHEDDYRLVPDLLLMGSLTREATARAENSGIEIYDLEWLSDLALALDGSGVLDATIELDCPEGQRLVSETEVGTLCVCEVKARDIANWPGIEDRSLFGLNVRGELRGTKVFSELDAAINEQAQTGNFIAFHNGLTVICRQLELSPETVTIEGISVVNGAQSVLAFHRHPLELAESDMKVLVKFVQEDGTHAGFATEVARRSNTQTAVNPRNLRANDGRQQGLAQQFAELGTDFSYITKPDATVQPPGEHIRNDDAAQWLCAVYNQRPWLAVKRQELFRSPNYSQIFRPTITASHILFLHLLRERLQEARDNFPEPYRKSWRLTAVMSMYLAGEFIRNDNEMKTWISEPQNALAMVPEDRDLTSNLDRAIAFVAKTLSDHHESRTRDFGFDDYKVDFKREAMARELSRKVSKSQRVEEA